MDWNILDRDYLPTQEYPKERENITCQKGWISSIKLKRKENVVTIYFGQELAYRLHTNIFESQKSEMGET